MWYCFRNKILFLFKHFRLRSEISYKLQNSTRKKERKMLLLVQQLMTAIENLLKWICTKL